MKNQNNDSFEQIQLTWSDKQVQSRKQINYKHLLKKYMKAICEAEGVYYTDYGNFDAFELEVLERLIKEIDNEYEN